MNRYTLIALFASISGCAASYADSPAPPRACKPAATTAETYMLAWNTPDREVRRCLLASAWSERGRFVDPTADVVGVDALVDHIGGYLKQFPGTRIEPSGPVMAHHDVIHFPWRIVAGGKTVIEGKDFGQLDRQGKLVLLVGFFPSPPPAK